MGMPALSQSTYWTAAMVRELPDDGNRYECIDGELLVTPSPRTIHQVIVGALYRVLSTYVEETGIGLALTSPLDIELDEGMIVQPDVLVSRLVPGLRDGRVSGRHLFLTVEVLSPSTARRDRGLKRTFYERIGVPEYWIVHPASRLVERWRHGAAPPVWEEGALAWHPEGAARPLTIDLPALFDSVPDILKDP